IDLKGTRESIMPVILSDVQPIHQHCAKNPQRKHGDHAYPYKQQPMGMRAALCWLYLWECRGYVVLSRYSASAWGDVRRQVVHVDDPVVATWDIRSLNRPFASVRYLAFITFLGEFM